MRRAIALAFVALALSACCDPKGQFQLVATVVDGPTGQLIPTPSFSGAAAYAKCQSYYGDMAGAGGGGQNKGPCFKWIVYADENGGEVIVGAEGYEAQQFAVPKAKSDECGMPDTDQKTFRLKRAP